MKNFLKRPEVNSLLATISLPVRITDLNYGNHLAHAHAVGIIHQARVLCLEELGFKENDIEGTGLILGKAFYAYRKETFFNDLLDIKIYLAGNSNFKMELYYEIIHAKTQQIHFEGQEEFAFLDYSTRKITKIPDSFLEKLSQPKET